MSDDKKENGRAKGRIRSPNQSHDENPRPEANNEVKLSFGTTPGPSTFKFGVGTSSIPANVPHESVSGPSIANPGTGSSSVPVAPKVSAKESSGNEETIVTQPFRFNFPASSTRSALSTTTPEINFNMNSNLSATFTTTPSVKNEMPPTIFNFETIPQINFSFDSKTPSSSSSKKTTTQAKFNPPSIFKGKGDTSQTFRDRVGTIATFLADVDSWTDRALVGDFRGNDSLRAIHKALVEHNEFSRIEEGLAKGKDKDAIGSSPKVDEAHLRYKTAWELFEKRQWNRHGKHLPQSHKDLDKAEQAAIIQRYRDTLKYAITHAETSEITLSADRIKEWHQKVVPGMSRFSTTGQGGQSEEYRKVNIIGTTVYCTATRVPAEMQKYEESLTKLSTRWLNHPASTKVRCEHENAVASTSGSAATDLGLQSTLGIIALAAASFIGLFDIHPYISGNGRVSRIAANWALHRGGIPFLAHMLSSPSIKREYGTAINLTRQRVQEAMTCKNDDGVEFKRTWEGVLAPIVTFLIDRLYAAICDFQQTKLSFPSASTNDAAMFRNYRADVVASGTCIICLEGSPNVEMLCCGQAVHLNCIGEWLRENTTCVTCRAPLPATARPSQATEARRSSNPADNPDNGFHVTDMETILRMAMGGMEMEEEPCQCPVCTARRHRMLLGDMFADYYDDESDYGYDESYDDSEDDDDDEEDDRICHGNNCSNIRASDCPNRLCGRCCHSQGTRPCSRHGRT